MVKSFLITSVTGRCGSTFLSKHMNSSKVWTVKHDVKSPEIGEPFKPYAQKRFTGDYYGEVNTYLRRCFQYIDVDRYGFIIRNPYDIFISARNWRPKKSRLTQAKTIRDGYKLIPEESDSLKLILFERMVSDKKYLKEIFDFFDIRDVDIDKIDLKKKINKPKKYTSNLSNTKLPDLASEFNIYTKHKKILMG